MRAITFTELGQAQSLQAIVNKLQGLPKKGTPSGKGIHSTIPQTPTGPGWTTSYAPILKHPTKSAWCHCIDEGIEAALADTEKAKRLSTQEKQILTDLIAQAKELPSDWTPDTP